jgi:VIT1/CCC1 family predicted Fe2+/Mn2+ transporter
MTIKVPNDAKKSSAAQTIREKLKTYFSSLKKGVDFGIKYVLKWLFIIAVIANFIIGMSFAVLPELADQMGGPSYYGYMLSAMAGGTLLGVVGAPLAKNLPLGKLSGLLFLIGGLFWSASLFFSKTRSPSSCSDWHGCPLG